MKTPVADIIMELLANGGRKGLPMQPSEELAQYLSHNQGQKRMTGLPPQAYAPDSNVAMMDNGRAGGQARPAVMPEFDNPVPPPVDPAAVAELQNPNFDQMPTTAQGPGNVVEGPFKGGPIGEQGAQPELFIYATDESGRKMRLDGPFPSPLVAQGTLKRLQAQTGLKLSLEPMPAQGPTPIQ